MMDAKFMAKSNASTDLPEVLKRLEAVEKERGQLRELLDAELAAHNADTDRLEEKLEALREELTREKEAA